jgi:transcriptional regulator with XRE-family HTH domain
MKKIKVATNNGLGALLRKSREKLDISVRHAANSSGASFSYIASVERGEVERPKIKILEHLADIYGIDKDTVIIMAGKIPSDVYWRIVHNPKLLPIIRDMKI